MAPRPPTRPDVRRGGNPLSPGHRTDRTRRHSVGAGQGEPYVPSLIKRSAIALAVPTVGLFAWSTFAGAGHTNAVLETELRSRNEVDPEGTNRNVGDRNGRGEAYVFGIDGDPNTLCYVLTVDKIRRATMAHIHKGGRNENGPVVVNLAAPADGSTADCLTEGEEGKFVGDQTVAEILENPREYCVNVHNAQFPGGAIRGQLQYER